MVEYAIEKMTTDEIEAAHKRESAILKDEELAWALAEDEAVQAQRVVHLEEASRLAALIDVRKRKRTVLALSEALLGGSVDQIRHDLAMSMPKPKPTKVTP